MPVNRKRPSSSLLLSSLWHSVTAKSTDLQRVHMVLASLWKSYSGDGGYHSVACGSVLLIDLD